MDEEMRIPFLKGADHASKDKKIFQAYMEGFIDEKEAARRIGLNNNCKVTVEQFLYNYWKLGYYQ